MKAKIKNLQLRLALIGLCSVAIMFGPTTGSVLAHEDDPHPHAEDSEVGDTKSKPSAHGSLGNVGHKLANPLASLWALSMNFETPKFYDGDANTGDPKLGADMIFQPLMPLPLYGEGKAEWRLHHIGHHRPLRWRHRFHGRLQAFHKVAQRGYTAGTRAKQI